MSRASQIPFDRLFEAIDATCRARTELAAIGVRQRPSRSMGRAHQPVDLASFTVHEIIEAERFLERCGIEVIEDDAAPST